MEEDDDTIYENRETIRRHIGGFKPTIERRPGTIGQETRQEFDEENLYENQDNVPKEELYLAPEEGGGQVENDQNSQETYEPLNASQSPLQSKSPFLGPGVGYAVPSAKQDDKKANEKSAKPATDYRDPAFNEGGSKLDEIQKQKSQPKMEESIELRTWKNGSSDAEPMSFRKSKAISRAPWFLGVFAIILALVSLVLALLLTFNVIERGNCECQKEIDELRVQIQHLKTQIKTPTASPPSKTPILTPFKTSTLGTQSKKRPFTTSFIKFGTLAPTLTTSGTVETRVTLETFTTQITNTSYASTNFTASPALSSNSSHYFVSVSKTP